MAPLWTMAAARLPVQLVLVAAVGVAALVGWRYGEHRAVLRYEARLAQQAQAAQDAMRRLAAARDAAAAQVVTQYVDRVQVVRERGKEIIKEVAVYVPMDAGCDLPGAWRVLHDAAARGRLPQPADAADAAPASAHDAARTVAHNYSACHETAQQLTALQDWVRQMQEVRP